jgi:hypothetical protein
LAGVVRAEEFGFGLAFSALPHSSGRPACRRDRAQAPIGHLKALSGDVLPGLVVAGCGVRSQKPGGLEGLAESFGLVFDAASMQIRLPQLSGLLEDYGNRGGCDHPSRQDAVGAPLHRLDLLLTGSTSLK